MNKNLPIPLETSQTSRPVTIPGFLTQTFLSSKAVDIGSAICHSCSFNSAGSTVRSLQLAEEFHLLHCQSLTTKKGSISTVPYRVFSSTRPPKPQLPTRVPFSQPAAAASAPSGHVTHRLTAKGGCLRPWAFFFPPGQTPSALKQDAAPPALPPAHLLTFDCRRQRRRGGPGRRGLVHI